MVVSTECLDSDMTVAKNFVLQIAKRSAIFNFKKVPQKQVLTENKTNGKYCLYTDFLSYN